MPTDLTTDQLLDNLAVKVSAPPGTTRANAEPEMLFSADELRATGRTFAGMLERLEALEAGGTPTPAAPTISGASPNSGAVGTSVTINGTNLANATGLTLNGVNIYASKTANTATTVVFTVPSGAASGIITVTTAGGTATSTGSFTVTSDGGSAKSGIQQFRFGDSRDVYPGNTGDESTTSVVALINKRFADAGHTEFHSQQQGYPGWTGDELLTLTSDNPNYPDGGKPTGMTAVQYCISLFDHTKYIIVEIGGLANGINYDPVPAISSMCDAFRAAGADFIIANPLINRLDYTTEGLPNRDAHNAAIFALQGVKTDDTARTDLYPEIYAADAPNDPAFFWMNDRVGLSKVHLTTLGNILLAEASSQAIARCMGISLPEGEDVRQVVYTDLSANEAYGTGSSAGYLQKVAGGTAAWDSGAAATVLLNQPAIGETLVVSYGQPRAAQGSIFGITDSTFTRAGYAFLDNAFYYDANDAGVLANGGFIASPVTRIAGKPSIRVYRQSNGLYQIESRVGATLKVTQTDVALTFPLRVACSLAGSSAGGAHPSEASPAVVIGTTLS